MFDRPELTTVVCLNLSIALGGFALSAYIWHLRGVLSRFADNVTRAERGTRRTLRAAPRAIRRSQQHTHLARARYRHLLQRLAWFQQLLALSLWLLRFARRGKGGKVKRL
ncbi:MAG: hypothetical protein J7641_16120 [Cyanobacteria bacterium SID2]|nr:hypothetical protein [Cyanobacteria bacterium SID2]MBP0006112.1 hypothetical protein [Cyanobacteria bacterium SBC]